MGGARVLRLLMSLATSTRRAHGPSSSLTAERRERTRGAPLSAAELVASLVESRVLVFGSLPPHGADLDLLVRPAEEEVLAAALGSHGFERRGRTWARFAECSAEVIELVPTASWGLPADELERLFSEARPIEASGKICRPAPHHALLILARRAIGEGSRLREPRRARVEEELAADPLAFDRAASRVAAWRAARSLRALERGYRSRRRLGLWTRLRAAAERLDAPSRRHRALGAARAVLRRPRRGAVVALSGLDGSGKSSQAQHLAETFERLGSDVEVIWTSLASHPRWLRALAGAVKWPLAIVARVTGRRADSRPAPGLPDGSEDPAKALRARSSILTFAWSMTLTLRLAADRARAAWPALLRGRLVICDRYELDTLVHMRYQFGERRRFRAQRALLRLASPRPTLAYLLDVPPQTACRRKQDFTLEQNARRARIYREQASELGVRVIDGTRPESEICADLAREVWRSLR